MRRLLMAVLGSALVALPGTPASAHAQSALAGSWIVEYYRTVSGHGGEGEAQLARARITLTAAGDSVTGQWEDLASDGTALGRPRELRGHRRGGTVTLSADPVQAVIKSHLGPDQRVQLVFSYEFVQRGDSLVGTQRSRSVDGKITNAPRVFVAVRERP